MEFDRGRKLSEATLTAKLWSKLNDIGIECHLEYKYGPCRFDAVVVVDDKVWLIVEMKSVKRRVRNGLSKQIMKYVSLTRNVPIIKMVNESALTETVRLINGYINHGDKIKKVTTV